MNKKALFEGLVLDEHNQPVEVAYVGGEPCYVVNDQGFRRHIDAEIVDRQVLELFKDMIEGHEDLISDQAAKMLGQDDIFSKANISQQIKNMEQYFDRVIQMGIPESQRAYMGMMGFKIRINVHGEVLEIEQPGMIDPEDGG